ncbi:MAG TPA: acetyl-CoA carboxylase biotin carboxyl carrier protein [Candidatus Polarisedimenticolia bacterium]
MENKELKELMEYIALSSFAEFEMERDGFKLKLVKEGARSQNAAGHNSSGAPTLPAGSAAGPSAPAIAPVPGATAAAPVPVASAGADLFQVTSPMVGTFYRSSSPTSPPFVQVGDTIKKGQVICIIEAMKLMNEIESEVTGEIVDIPVSNGQPVEYSEVLFRVRVTSP